MMPQTEKRTEKQTGRILETIQRHDRIVISRHVRPDGDCVGASLALKRIINLTWPEKDVRVINSDYAEKLEFLGREDPPLEDYSLTLVIVLDTSDAKRISNPMYDKGSCLVKIDHHIDSEQYADINWIESNRSSVCEMIALFYSLYSKTLKIDTYAATCLYAGICTDSGRFRYSNTSPETLRLAAMLLEKGVDAQRLFVQLDVEDLSFLRFQAKALEKIEISPAGVAYLYIPMEMRKNFNLTDEYTSNAVDFMNSIRGSLIWILFIQTEKEIRVRLRSRFVPINGLASRYRGGGHANACGATLYRNEEIDTLVKDADKLLSRFRKENPELY